MTAEQLFRQCIKQLTPSLGASEARSAAKIIFEDVRGMTPTDLALYGHRELEDFTVSHINGIVSKIEGGMPVQYAIGSARFCGMDFDVNQAVLIPRPETEWLVDRICDDYRNTTDLSILDCGTGSGCIAIALARALTFANIIAIDISDDALAMARHNAQKLNVDVQFLKEDILNMPVTEKPIYDIIVSNPPYIADFEKPSIDRRVIDYEPATALFVNNDNPLVFYKAIAKYGLNALKPGGRLYLELNPLFGNDLREHLENLGYDDVELYRDYIGHIRYIVATKSK